MGKSYRMVAGVVNLVFALKRECEDSTSTNAVVELEQGPVAEVLHESP